MAVAFQELLQRAEQRWQDLSRGQRAWVRIGGGVSGESAGSDAVEEAFEKALEAVGVDANLTRVAG